jgi:hypothetical protein
MTKELRLVDPRWRGVLGDDFCAGVAPKEFDRFSEGLRSVRDTAPSREIAEKATSLLAEMTSPDNSLHVARIWRKVDWKKNPPRVLDCDSTAVLVFMAARLTIDAEAQNFAPFLATVKSFSASGVAVRGEMFSRTETSGEFKLTCFGEALVMRLGAVS